MRALTTVWRKHPLFKPPYMPAAWVKLWKCKRDCLVKGAARCLKEAGKRRGQREGSSAERFHELSPWLFCWFVQCKTELPASDTWVRLETDRFCFESKTLWGGKSVKSQERWEKRVQRVEYFMFKIHLAAQPIRWRAHIAKNFSSIG